MYYIYGFLDWFKFQSIVIIFSFSEIWCLDIILISLGAIWYYASTTSLIRINMAGQDVIPIVIVYLSVSYSVHSFTPEVVTIGAVLDSTDMMKVFTQTVENINSKPWILPGLKFNSTAMLMNRNPISSALAVCEQLIIHRVYTVIISHPPGSSEAPISVSYICGYYHIPVIGISARNSILSDKVSNIIIFKINLAFLLFHDNFTSYEQMSHLWLLVV